MRGWPISRPSPSVAQMEGNRWRARRSISITRRCARRSPGRIGCLDRDSWRAGDQLNQETSLATIRIARSPPLGRQTQSSAELLKLRRLLRRASA